MTFYHPRPERWPQFTLKGLLIAVTLSALLLPWAIAEYRRLAARARVPASGMLMIDIPLIIGEEEEARLGRFPLPD